MRNPDRAGWRHLKVEAWEKITQLLITGLSDQITWPQAKNTYSIYLVYIYDIFWSTPPPQKKKKII